MCIRDRRYFESAELPRAELVHLLRSKAVLMPGVKVTLTIEKANRAEPERHEWRFADGRESEDVAEGEGATWCIAFTEDGNAVRESYVNLIPTVAGGTHESGLKDGLFTAVKGFIDMHSLLPKGVKVMPDDVFSRASFVLSAKVLDPQFQGQIKERLNSREALRLVSACVRPACELWLSQHVEHGRKLAELVIRQAQTRQRASQRVEKKKGSGVAVLPGKLTDCESRDLALNELFLVDVLVEPQLERRLDAGRDQPQRVAAVETLLDLALELRIEHLRRQHEAGAREDVLGHQLHALRQQRMQLDEALDRAVEPVLQARLVRPAGNRRDQVRI